ncbi:MAG TPA: hotdog fold thioesterase, partial [Burkholderiaceae bacterium]
MATPEQVREAMFANDRASKALGMEVVSIAVGRATVTMLVRDDMLNGFDICHGGLIATLADSAFAFACNARNEMTVASGFDVSLVAPAHVGDRLRAEAVEAHMAGRTGL